MTARAVIRQADVQRIVTGAEAAGKNVARIDIDPSGKVSIIFGDAEQPAGSAPNPWDEDDDPS